MILTARLLTLLAVFFFTGACSHPGASQPGPVTSKTDAPLAASSYRLVGRILAIDAPRGFAFVDLAASAPAAALTEGAELIARTEDLRETARLRPSRYVRGRTLGTAIISGQPALGDEVVFRTP